MDNRENKILTLMEPGYLTLTVLGYRELTLDNNGSWQNYF